MFWLLCSTVSIFIISSWPHRCSFWAAVCKNSSPYPIGPLSVLSVMLVYCGQMVGWIKMKLGTQVGLRSGHIVSDGDPPHPPPRRHSPQFPDHICCGQMAEWIKMPLGMQAGLDPSDSVRWGPSSPVPKRGQSPQFLDYVYCCQTAGWIKITLGTELASAQATLLDGDPASSAQKRWHTTPNFRPMSIVVKQLDGSTCHLVWR